MVPATSTHLRKQGEGTVVCLENKTREVPIFSRDHPQILHPQGNGRTRPPPRCEMLPTHMSQLSRWPGGSPGLQGRSRSATSEGYRESYPKKSRGRGRTLPVRACPQLGQPRCPSLSQGPVLCSSFGGGQTDPGSNPASSESCLPWSLWFVI